MNRTIAALLSLVASLATANGAAAQNLVISNARIIVGPGQVIERGAVVVNGGRIASVAAGTAPAAPTGAKVIDATGMTVIAGYIDDHRHILQARGERSRFVQRPSYGLFRDGRRGEHKASIIENGGFRPKLPYKSGTLPRLE